jgi:uncharacterized HAD superfamily protein
MLSLDNKEYELKVHDAEALQLQLRKTIAVIDQKILEVGQEDIQAYKDKYEAALISLTQNADDIDQKLRSLKGGVRGYMEVSSNYLDPFLTEMEETEQMIKRLGF